MSDRIAVMNEGRVEQIGTPFEIYNYPRTRFVASFVGTLNILSGRVVDAASGRIEIDGQQVVVARGLADAQAGEGRSLALRPQAVSLGYTGPGRNRPPGRRERGGLLAAIARIRTRV